MSVLGDIYITGKKIYTAGGSDKSHLWATYGETWWRIEHLENQNNIFEK